MIIKRKARGFLDKMLLSSNRGQLNFFTVLFTASIFFIMMALGVGKMINTMIGIGVEAGGVTGIEAFFLDNFVLWILFVATLWFMGAMSQT